MKRMEVEVTKSKADIARRYLIGTDPDQDESEDELSREDTTWEWIYGNIDKSEVLEAEKENDRPMRDCTKSIGEEKATRRSIVGARNGGFECFVGDILRLKADRNESWIALLVEFVDDDNEDEKCANFLWFSSPKDIRNKAKRRNDALPNEVYISAAADINTLETVQGRAEIVSIQTFRSRYPTGKIPPQSRDHGKLFVCRYGCNTRTTTYTDLLVWEDVYKGADDIEELKSRIENETKASRKRKAEPSSSLRPIENFVVADDADDVLKTPSKRRKLDPNGTPRSKKGLKFSTPTHKRIITKKPLEFTPLGTRVLSPSHYMSSPFQHARNHLHVSSVPTALPCRESEFSTVYSYLESAITEGTGSCMYISGTPGTGKTATVREVVAQLHASVQAEELDDFIFVEINGMKVTDPHQSYALLWEALSGDRVSPTHALSLLEREFSTPSPRRVPCVVLMDELDQLVTKTQSVMYNFFNWPTFRHSRLIVLAVANTMDLPERTLSNKISSRLGLTRVTFQGYTHPQLIQIIESRLAGVPGNIVDADAIQFASRKVAQVSGDARRALDICRRAVELAEADAAKQDTLEGDDITAPDTPSKRNRGLAHSTGQENKRPAGTVTIATIQRAIREATSSPLQLYLRHLPLASKVFLAALLARMRRTGIGESLLGDVADEAKRIGAMSDVPGLREWLLDDTADGNSATDHKKARRGKDVSETVARILGMGAAATELLEAGVVVVEDRGNERGAKVRLQVAEEEVKGALRNDEDVRGLGFNVS